MPISVLDFWKLSIESGLFSPPQCERLRLKFGEVARADSDVLHLARWLISRGLMTRYQARLLLSGRAGPLAHGPYKIIDQLARGLLGSAYLAVHQPTSHPVILQFPPVPEAGQVAAWPEIARRAASLVPLRHPCLGRVFEYYENRPYRLAVTEQPSGRSLHDRVQASGPVPAPEACRLIWHASLALDQIHQAGLVHGAVRPHALWRTTTGNALLVCDAVWPPRAWKLTASRPRDDLAALADYLAPELAHADKMPDVQTDIYALGCTFHFLLAGRPPFPGTDVAQKMHRHATQPIAPLTSLPGLCPEIERIVSLMMAKRADVRFPQAVIVAQQLAEVMDQRELTLQPEKPLPTLAAFEATLGMTDPPTVFAPATVQTGPPPFSLDASQEKSIGTGEGGAVSSGATLEPTMDAACSIASHVQLNVAPANLPHRYAARKRTNRRLAVALMTATVLLIAVTGYIALSGTGGDNGHLAANSAGTREKRDDSNDDALASRTLAESDSVRPDEGSSDSLGVSSDGVQQTVSYVLAVDDGQILWAPPTNGQPIVFRYLPTGAQLVLILRPADLLGRPEGQKVFRGLGPRFESLRQTWELAAGVKLEEIEQLTIALVPQNEQAPRSVLIIHLRQPADPGALWGNRPSIKVGDATIYAVDDWHVCVPATEGNRVVAMGTIDDMKQMARSSGLSPPLRRQLAQLQQLSDAERHVTILLARNFLFSDGRKLLTEGFEKILPPLDLFLGDQIQACLLSLHFGDIFYAEARFVGTLDVTPTQLATELKDRLRQVPARVEQYLGGVQLGHWQPLAVKFPAMIRYLANQTRADSQLGQAVLNCVLPGPAAHNLTLGSELALSSAPATGTVAGRQPRTVPRSIEDLLRHRMSLDIPQQSLESALRDLAAEVRDEFPGLSFPFRLEILGADLREEGITRNQQIKDFHRSNQTVAELLTGLVIKANPVTTVLAPSEPDQKLIWVVAPDPDDPNHEVVLITTRRAAPTEGLPTA